MLMIDIYDENLETLCSVGWPAVPLVGERIFINDAWWIVRRRDWSTAPDWVGPRESVIHKTRVGVELHVEREAPE